MLHILKSTVHLYIAVGRVENGQNITPFREVSIFFFLQDAQKSALQLAKSSLKITDVGKKKKKSNIKHPYFKSFMHSFVFLTNFPPPPDSLRAQTL